MDLNLAGKTALVTAASGGIGRGVAEALAEAGVRVAISGRTAATLEKVADTLASRAGGRPAIVVGDVCAKDPDRGRRRSGARRSDRHPRQ